MQKSVYIFKFKQRKMSKLEELGYIGVKVILYLSKVREANISSLIKELHVGKQTIYYRLKVLRLYNLVTHEKQGVEKIYRLTEEGKKLAELLQEIDELMEVSIKKR